MQHLPEDILAQVKSFAQDESSIIRISIANLISDITGDVYGIINKKGLQYGRRKLSSIGGAAELYDRSFFESLGGHDFEKEDCRFKIPFSRAHEVLKIADKNVPEFMEGSPQREIVEELSEEVLPGFMNEPILSQDEANSLKPTFAGIMYESGYGTSETRSLITLYIWRYFSLSGSKEVLKKLKSHNVIHKVSLRECDEKRTSKGIYVGPNVIAAGKLIY